MWEPWDSFQLEIVRKIREAPDETEAKRRYTLARRLEHEFAETFPSAGAIKSLLEELAISDETKEKILSPEMKNEIASLSK